MSPDPASWLVVEKGWKVVGSDGAELGTVAELIGDTGKDIFNGLSVSPGLLKGNRYVPSEHVTQIFDGRIELDIDADAFAELDEHGDVPPSAEVRADTTDLPGT